MKFNTNLQITYYVTHTEAYAMVRVGGSETPCLKIFFRKSLKNTILLLILFLHKLGHNLLFHNNKLWLYANLI